MIKASPPHLIESANWLSVKHTLGDCEDAVAVDDTGLSKSLGLTDLDFGPDASDGAGKGGTGHRREYGDCRVSGQDANGSPTSRGTEVSPVDLAPHYHSGAVSAARRRAASMS